jgi:peptidyl-prolyl cis-trans isomerase SurA
MTHRRRPPAQSWHPLAAVGAVMLLAAVPVEPVQAQAIVAIVNGAPISTMDVQNRMALIHLSHQQATQKQIVEDLIDERLKMLEARRLDMLPSDKEVDAAFASIAQRSKLTPEQLTKALSQRGVNAATLKSRIKAEIGWGQFVRRKFKAVGPTVSDLDVAMALANRKDKEKDKDKADKAATYTLRQVILPLPKDASVARIAQRKQEAAALRGRFQSCDQGLTFIKGLKDIAVKEPMTRATAQLSPQQEEILRKTRIGALTEPEKTDVGIEMIAVCERKELNDDSLVKRNVQDELTNEKMQVEAKKYLNDLRSRAIIEYRS